MIAPDDIALLKRVWDFLDDEADNRGHAGSSEADYEREPRELAEEVQALIDRWA